MANDWSELSEHELAVFQDIKRRWIVSAKAAIRCGDLDKAAHCRRMAYRWHLRIVQKRLFIDEL